MLTRRHWKHTCLEGYNVVQIICKYISRSNKQTDQTKFEHVFCEYLVLLNTTNVHVTQDTSYFVWNYLSVVIIDCFLLHRSLSGKLKNPSESCFITVIRYVRLDISLESLLMSSMDCYCSHQPNLILISSISCVADETIKY